ncbi:adenosylcobinamide-GDP ribazoletransferase [Desulfosoma sp.]
MWKDVGMALGFLSRLRLPGQGMRVAAPEEIARSLAVFPVIGLILGALQAAAGWGLSFAFSGELSALWVVGLGTWLTRGLHLDGLADVADGVGGAYEPSRRLAIMKDSRVGAFGVLALIFGIGLKVFAVSGLLAAHRWSALIVVPALSRCTMVFCTYKIPYARSEGGLGKGFLDHVGRRELVWAAAWAGTAAVALERVWGLVLVVMALAAAVPCRRAAKRWIGGMTGDMLGAVNEVTEIALYHAALVFRGGGGG